MTLLLPTTTVRWYRPTGRDPYLQSGEDPVAAGVEAHVSSPTGTGTVSQEVVDAVLSLPADSDLRRQDRVEDEVTGDAWEVVWTRVRRGLGLDHRAAGLRQVQGSG